MVQLSNIIYLLPDRYLMVGVEETVLTLGQVHTVAVLFLIQGIRQILKVGVYVFVYQTVRCVHGFYTCQTERDCNFNSCFSPFCGCLAKPVFETIETVNLWCEYPLKRKRSLYPLNMADRHSMFIYLWLVSLNILLSASFPRYQSFVTLPFQFVFENDVS